MARGRPWSEDEIVLAMGLYCRTSFGRLHQSNPDIVRLAGAIARTPASVAMKCCNFASLDPAEHARGIKGLSGASVADREVFFRLAHDIEALDTAYEAASAKLLRPPDSVPAASIDPPDEQIARRLIESTASPDESRLRRERRLQSLFRQVVMIGYDSACAVCELGVAELLDAAHIRPWGQEHNRRLDLSNGVAMCSLHHRAFDRGFLTVDPDYSIRLSRRLLIANPPPFHKSGLLEFCGCRLRLPSRFQPQADAFDDHRKNVFRDE